MKFAITRLSTTQNVTTTFEENYTSRVNTYWYIFLLLHLPVFLGLVLFEGGSVMTTLVVALILLAGPGVLLLQDRSSSLASVAIAVSAMGMSALAIHLSSGLIEAHFELFALLALLIVFGKPAPMLAAGATIALHHVIFWLWLPSSIFNYKATFSTVMLHAFFVVLEVIPACWIAVQFGKSIRVQGIVMEQLGGSADQVTASAREISQASSRLADAAVRQASMVQETSNSSQEMSAGATQNRNTSDEILVLMRSMEDQLVQANSDLTSMQHVVGGMVQSSKQISKVVKLIDGIAFQTNILSLNAAVEAASAGESGAGFSVVAKEVGNLAQKSATAATDTAVLIEHTLQSTLTGEKAALALSSAMSRVTETAAQVRDKLALLQTSCEGQEKTVSQMRLSINELGTGAQETAAVAEESSAAGACLTEQAVGLREIVQLLRV